MIMQGAERNETKPLGNIEWCRDGITTMIYIFRKKNALKLMNERSDKKRAIHVKVDEKANDWKS